MESNYCENEKKFLVWVNKESQPSLTDSEANKEGQILSLELFNFFNQYRGGNLSCHSF